jgi:hypothetical protein
VIIYLMPQEENTGIRYDAKVSGKGADSFYDAFFGRQLLRGEYIGVDGRDSDFLIDTNSGPVVLIDNEGKHNPRGVIGDSCWGMVYGVKPPVDPTGHKTAEETGLEFDKRVRELGI